MDYIKAIEKCLNKEAQKEYLPLQPGDVTVTASNCEELKIGLDLNLKLQYLKVYLNSLIGTKIFIKLRINFLNKKLSQFLIW